MLQRWVGLSSILFRQIRKFTRIYPNDRAFFCKKATECVDLNISPDIHVHSSLSTNLRENNKEKQQQQQIKNI